MRVTSSVVIGSIIYKGCVALALRLGLPSTDLKLITAVLFLVILVVSMDRNKSAKIKETADSKEETAQGGTEA